MVAGEVRMMELYKFDTDVAVPSALSYAFGDTQFNYGVRGLARGMSKVQPKTFRYLFTRSPGVIPPAPTHSEEIDFAFANLGANRCIPRGAFDATDGMLSAAMADAWVRFASTGDPNGGTLPYWPAYDGGSDPYLEFGDNIRVGQGYRTAYLYLVERFLTKP
jgi:carboxylesterase type B